MKKIFCRILLVSVLVICTTTPFSFSLAADRDIQAKSEGWIASGKELLGPSWFKNPKRFDFVPSSLLYQITANYSYLGEDGNVDKEKHEGAAELILRKDLLTSVTRYKINRVKTEKALNGVSINKESERFFQALRYPFSEWIQAVAGGSWRINDTAKFLDNRSNVFIGALFDVVDRPNIFFRLGAFYGYSDVTYMNSKLTGIPNYTDFTPIDDYTSDDIFLMQKFRWNITDTITFTENAEYTQLLKDTEYYFWTVDFGLEFKLAKHLSFVTTYEMDYEYSDFTEAVQNYFDKNKALGRPAGEMYELDTTLSVGIKVTF
ncbi:MAG: DUF481 domain-containing protein [Candidatus Electrothrix sp. AX2]|nr:DUF481 domain-containing protein [Candidatus Electrothrix gigas]